MGTTHVAVASITKHLWPVWQINNPLSTDAISHKDWQSFLDAHVKTNEEGINLLDYSNISETGLNLLDQYITDMSHVKIDNYNRNEQLAYWINLYNALVVKTVARYYPVGSIEEINISPGIFSIGPWGAQLITIQGIGLTLDDIQNRIIRAIWNDPRTLYALNNACIGAPNISKQAYQSTNLEQQLNQAAANYINSYRGVQVIEGKLVVSKLYDWFSEDFGGGKQAVIKHIKHFAQEPLLSQLNHINSIDNYVYNWHLNSTVESSGD
jgi:hypothetical protein